MVKVFSEGRNRIARYPAVPDQSAEHPSPPSGWSTTVTALQCTSSHPCPLPVHGERIRCWSTAASLLLENVFLLLDAFSCPSEQARWPYTLEGFQRQQYKHRTTQQHQEGPWKTD